MVYDLPSSLVADRTPLPIVGVLPRTPHAYGTQNEYGYRTTGGMGALGSRTGMGSVAATGMSGTVALTFFRACRTQVLSRWDMATCSTPFGATPTLIRGGLYTLDSLSNLTLAASSANDTTLGTVANTKFGKAFSTALEVYFGLWYAYAFLWVSAAAAPTLLGPASAAGSTHVALDTDPRVNGVFAGQSDLPAAITVAQVAAANTMFWAELS
jgi:hypothetical protein